jgi:hypothetical protein
MPSFGFPTLLFSGFIYGHYLLLLLLLVVVVVSMMGEILCLISVHINMGLILSSPVAVDCQSAEHLPP